MELFDKVYSCYYQVVRQILLEAEKQPVTRQRMEELAGEYGFQESSLTILPKLIDGEWALLKELPDKTYGPAVLNLPELPLTALQKSWLKSMTEDKRIRLFLREDELTWLKEELKETKVLYNQEDFYYFDRYRDGDEYESERYQEQFRTILQALEQKKALFVAYEGKHGRDRKVGDEADTVTYEAVPYQLQYSPKDNKFRLCCLLFAHGHPGKEIVFNLARIRGLHLSKREVVEDLSGWTFNSRRKTQEPIVIEISGERNSLERCMLHFADYEKHTEYDEEEKVYRCSIYYDKADETELLIEILSFGPVIRVLGPESFLGLVKRRVGKQHQLLYGASQNQ